MNDRHLMVVTTFAKANKGIKEEGYEAGDIAGLLDGESWKIDINAVKDLLMESVPNLVCALGLKHV